MRKEIRKFSMVFLVAVAPCAGTSAHSKVATQVDPKAMSTATPIFARELPNLAGKSLLASALEAAKLRLRPIIMTSLAFVVGLTPMMRATGPSALGNHSISIGAAGGMVSGVILGIFIIPVLFIVFQYLQEKVTRKPLAVINNEKQHSER